MTIIELIGAWAILLALISVMILRIEGRDTSVRRNSLRLSLPPSSAPLGEQLAQLKAKAREQYRNSLWYGVAGSVFSWVGLYFMGSKHEGSLDYLLTCLFVLINLTWLHGIWHYSRYRGARLSMLLDAQHQQAEQI